jgi:hypothetical protein
LDNQHAVPLPCRARKMARMVGTKREMAMEKLKPEFETRKRLAEVKKEVNGNLGSWVQVAIWPEPKKSRCTRR